MPKRIVNGHVVKDEGILTADDLAPSLGVRSHREWIKRMTVDSRAARVMLDGIAINFEPAGQAVVAEVNHGRWVVNCDCHGQENVTPNDPIFFCFSCYNVDNNYHVKAVIFPDSKEVAVLESALMERGFGDMHWLPGETAKDLKDQNKVLHEMGKLRKQKD